MGMWTLTPGEWDATRERVAKINVRAAKRGFTGRLDVTGTKRVVVEKNPAGVSKTRVVFDVEITGVAPAYGGWEFLAAVDAMPAAAGDEAGFVIRCAPGVDDAGVDRSALVAGRCEHCNVRSANRVHTYLVRDVETGQVRQVGSTCIKDFTGWAGKPVFLTIEEVEEDLFGDGVGGGTPATTVEDAIATAYVAVQMFGWVASGQEGATRHIVARALFGTDRASSDLRAVMADRLSEGDAVAAEIIATVTAELTGSFGYEANVRAVLAAQYVTERELGLLSSAVPAYERIIGRRAAREAARKAQAEKIPSRWFASIGDKVTVTGAVTTAMTIDGYANSTQRLIIIDTPGTIFKTITAAGWAWEVNAGEIITVTAAVKRHDTYRETEQTVLVRPKLVGRATVTDMGASITPPPAPRRRRRVDLTTVEVVMA